MVKKIIVRTSALLVLLFLLSACHLWDDGARELNIYCPGLRVDIAGIGYSGNGDRDVYAITYDRSFQKQVKDYFEKKENNFKEIKDDDLFNIEITDDKIIDESDNIVGKTILKSNRKVEVIFNETTRKIIIVDYLK